MTQKNEMSARALKMEELEMVNGGGYEETRWLPGFGFPGEGV